MKIRDDIQRKRVNLDSDFDSVDVLLPDLFNIKQGNAFYTKKRILENDWIGTIPVYSSNTENDGVLINIDKKAVKASDLYFHNCLTWAIDGTYAGKLYVSNITNRKQENKEEFHFTINNHSGILLPKNKDMYLPYFKYVMQPMFFERSKGYGRNKVGTNQNEDLSVKVPVDSNGDYDFDKQVELANRYETIEKVKAALLSELDSIIDCNIQFDVGVNSTN